MFGCRFALIPLGPQGVVVRLLIPGLQSASLRWRGIGTTSREFAYRNAILAGRTQIHVPVYAVIGRAQTPVRISNQGTENSRRAGSKSFRTREAIRPTRNSSLRSGASQALATSGNGPLAESPSKHVAFSFAMSASRSLLSPDALCSMTSFRVSTRDRHEEDHLCSAGFCRFVRPCR